MRMEENKRDVEKHRERKRETRSQTTCETMPEELNVQPQRKHKQLARASAAGVVCLYCVV